MELSKKTFFLTNTLLILSTATIIFTGLYLLNPEHLGNKSDKQTEAKILQLSSSVENLEKSIGEVEDKLRIISGELERVGYRHDSLEKIVKKDSMNDSNSKPVSKHQPDYGLFEDGKQITQRVEHGFSIYGDIGWKVNVFIEINDRVIHFKYHFDNPESLRQSGFMPFDNNYKGTKIMAGMGGYGHDHFHHLPPAVFKGTVSYHVWGTMTDKKGVEVELNKKGTVEITNCGLAFIFQKENWFSGEKETTYPGIDTSSGCACPFVYTVEEDSGNTQLIGTILKGQNAEYKNRRHSVDLPINSSEIIIHEKEHERAYIDYLALNIQMKDGSVKIIPAKSDLLSIVDSQFLILDKGSKTKLRFELPDISLIRTVKLESKGYYIPLY